jgi:hypothetical protein
MIHITQEDVTTGATVVLAVTAAGALAFNAKASKAAERAAEAAEKGVDAARDGVAAAERAADSSRDAAAASAANVQVSFRGSLTFGSRAAPIRFRCEAGRVYVRGVTLKRIVDSDGRVIDGPELDGIPDGFELPLLMHAGEVADFRLGEGAPWIPPERPGATAEIDVTYGFVADAAAFVKHEQWQVGWIPS